MATGGIGGVHRGAERSFDESADLEAIARNPVCVVCAGAKLVLDLALTLERLETLGVPVVGYGTDELPAFYVRSSGLRLEHRVEDALAAARVTREQRARGAGIVVAVPIAAGDALDRRETAAGPMKPGIARAPRRRASAGIPRQSRPRARPRIARRSSRSRASGGRRGPASPACARNRRRHRGTRRRRANRGRPPAGGERPR